MQANGMLRVEIDESAGVWRAEGSINPALELWNGQRVLAATMDEQGRRMISAPLDVTWQGHPCSVKLRLFAVEEQRKRGRQSAGDIAAEASAAAVKALLAGLQNGSLSAAALQKLAQG